MKTAGVVVFIACLSRGAEAQSPEDGNYGAAWDHPDPPQPSMYDGQWGAAWDHPDPTPERDNRNDDRSDDQNNRYDDNSRVTGDVDQGQVDDAPSGDVVPSPRVAHPRKAGAKARFVAFLEAMKTLPPERTAVAAHFATPATLPICSKGMVLLYAPQPASAAKGPSGARPKVSCAEPSAAAAVYLKGCTDGDPSSCAHLAFLNEHGNGVPKDVPRAAALYERACSEGAAGDPCFALALMVLHGEGATRDPSRVALLYSRACGRSVFRACNLLGESYQYDANDFERAGQLYLKACNGRVAAGCANIGWLYESGQGGLPTDARAAVRFYKQGCDGFNAAGCTALAHMYESGAGGLPKDAAKSLALYKRACSSRNNWACEQLARLAPPTTENSAGDK